MLQRFAQPQPPRKAGQRPCTWLDFTDWGSGGPSKRFLPVKKQPPPFLGPCPRQQLGPTEFQTCFSQGFSQSLISFQSSSRLLELARVISVHCSQRTLTG